MLWMIAAAVAGLVCAVLIFYLHAVKKQLRLIKAEIEKNRDKDYNRLITVSLFDKDVSDLAAAMNKSLDDQKKLKYDAERAEQSLRASVSDIAHDLRTPLSVIKGNLQLIEQENALTGDLKDHLRVSLEKAEALKNMTDEFFELAVLESDLSEVALSRINITNLLMEFLADNEGVITLANLTPEIDFAQRAVFALADEQLLMRIFGNLLGNILKHSTGRFSIILDESCTVAFENAVEDPSAIDVSRLFERTYRGDSSRRGSGAGLGLYIVRLLAGKQGAKVSAEMRGNILSIKIALKKAPDIR